MLRTPLYFIRLALLPFVLLGANPILAVETVEEIEECMQANFPKESSVQEITMRSFDRVGNPTTMEAKIYWNGGTDKGNKVLMKFNNPPDLRGASLLMLEKKGRNDMFMYLPELDKVRRVTSHMMGGSMFGTDFSYEEFERLQGMSEDATSARAPDDQVGDRPAYVIVQTPAEDAGSDYERVRSLVDRETCVPLKIEFFGKGDQLRKVLEVDFAKVTKEPTGWVPRELTMNDVVENTRTTLAVDSVEVNADIPRKMFTQSNLSRGH